MDGEVRYHERPAPRLHEIQHRRVCRDAAGRPQDVTFVVRYLHTGPGKMDFWPAGRPPPAERVA